MVIKEVEERKTPTDDEEDVRWGRQVDLAGQEYFSIIVDPIDAKDACDDGILGLMSMPPDVLTETLFSVVEEEVWFKATHVLWGPSIADYDDDEPVVGVRCTMVGFL